MRSRRCQDGGSRQTSCSIDAWPAHVPRVARHDPEAAMRRRSRLLHLPAFSRSSLLAARWHGRRRRSTAGPAACRCWCATSRARSSTRASWTATRTRRSGRTRRTSGTAWSAARTAAGGRRCRRERTRCTGGAGATAACTWTRWCCARGGQVMRLRLNLRLDTDADPGPTEYLIDTPRLSARDVGAGAAAPRRAARTAPRG